MGMCCKKKTDLVKKCTEYEVQGARPRGRPKKTWREIVEKDCQAHKLNREDAMDRNRWMKQIRATDDHDWCEWYRLTQVVQDKIQRAVCVITTIN